LLNFEFSPNMFDRYIWLSIRIIMHIEHFSYDWWVDFFNFFTCHSIAMTYNKWLLYVILDVLYLIWWSSSSSLLFRDSCLSLSLFFLSDIFIFKKNFRCCWCSLIIWWRKSRVFDWLDWIESALTWQVSEQNETEEEREIENKKSQRDLSTSIKPCCHLLELRENRQANQS